MNNFKYENQQRMKPDTLLLLHRASPPPSELAVSADRHGGIAMWLMGEAKPVAELAGAHDRDVHDLAWNPLGTVLATGEADEAHIPLETTRESLAATGQALA
jgi:hypothetical protein